MKWGGDAGSSALLPTRFARNMCTNFDGVSIEALAESVMRGLSMKNGVLAGVYIVNTTDADRRADIINLVIDKIDDLPEACDLETRMGMKALLSRAPLLYKRAVKRKEVRDSVHEKAVMYANNE